MRSKEQFKAYVYEKAEAKQAMRRKHRRLMISSIAACSVCICVVSAVFLMPQKLYKSANETTMNATDAAGGTYAVILAPETGALDAFGSTEATAAVENNAQDNIAANDFLPEEIEDSAEPMLKSCLFSINANNAFSNNASPRIAFYEILSDDTEDADVGGDEDADGKESNVRNDVRVGVTAYYLKKPEISATTVTYSGDAVTITVFADAEPIPFGAYVYYFTETLDEKKYIGQPIQLEFKLTSERDAVKNVK